MIGSPFCPRSPKDTAPELALGSNQAPPPFLRVVGMALVLVKVSKLFAMDPRLLFLALCGNLRFHYLYHKQIRFKPQASRCTDRIEAEHPRCLIAVTTKIAMMPPDIARPYQEHKFLIGPFLLVRDCPTEI
jgi:hypothetical protein